MKRYLLALPFLLSGLTWVGLMLADKGLAVASDRCMEACDPIIELDPNCQWPTSMDKMCVQMGQKVTRCFDTDACFRPLLKTCRVVFPWGFWR